MEKVPAVIVESIMEKVENIGFLVSNFLMRLKVPLRNFTPFYQYFGDNPQTDIGTQGE